MTENDQKKYGSAADLVVAGVSSILSLFSLTAPIGAMGSFGLLAWQNEQQQKFMHEVRQRLERVDKTKIDQFAVESDEFKALAVQAVEAASKSASELKRQALAQSLINSVTLPTSQFSSKQTLLRILSQMSDEEILALTVLYKEEPLVAAEIENYAAENRPRVVGVSEAEVASKYEWSEEETRVACEGLSQLGLVYDAVVGGIGYKRGTWRITLIASRLIELCISEGQT